MEFEKRLATYVIAVACTVGCGPNVGEVEPDSGTDLAISGDTLVVGSRNEDGLSSGINGDQAGDTSMRASGAVYAFARTGTSWTQEPYIKATNPDGEDTFGMFLALDGNDLVVASIFESSGARGLEGDQADNSVAGSGALYLLRRVLAAEFTNGPA